MVKESTNENFVLEI